MTEYTGPLNTCLINPLAGSRMLHPNQLASKNSKSRLAEEDNGCGIRQRVPSCTKIGGESERLKEIKKLISSPERYSWVKYKVSQYERDFAKTQPIIE
jgi:hypothetical protein